MPLTLEYLLGSNRLWNWVRLIASSWTTAASNHFLNCRGIIELFIQLFGFLRRWNRYSGFWPCNKRCVMVPDGGKRKRHNGHDSRAAWYAYFRSLRWARHFQLGYWQQCQSSIDPDHTLADPEIFYRVILFNRSAIEDILRNRLSH